MIFNPMVQASQGGAKTYKIVAENTTGLPISLSLPASAEAGTIVLSNQVHGKFLDYISIKDSDGNVIPHAALQEELAAQVYFVMPASDVTITY